MMILIFKISGGDNRDRTGDLSLAKAALSHLSYIPKKKRNKIPPRSKPALRRLMFLVGLSGFEPLTSRLSGVRSNQLSYRPIRTTIDISYMPECSLKTK